MGRGLLVSTGLASVAALVAFLADDTLRPRPATAVPVCRAAEAIAFACYEHRYTALVRLDGPRVALGRLDADQRRNGYVRAACHQLTHRVGRAAGEIDGIDALAEGRPVCASGFYHGVLQAVMGKLGPIKVIEQAAEVCAGSRSDLIQ